MTKTAAPAPVARTIEAIDTALIDLNETLRHTPDVHPRSADMLSGVLNGTAHLRYGRIERAASIVDAIRADLASA